MLLNERQCRLIAPVGIVAALNWEMDAFASRPAGNDQLLFETTGPGPAAAAAGAERAVARGAVCLVSWGTAGALEHGKPGDIVLAERVLDESLRAIATDSSLTEALAEAFAPIAPIYRGTLASASVPVTSVADKRALAETSAAIAVDMESAAIADVAFRSGLPVVVVRVIVDRCDRAVPAAAVAGMVGARARPDRVLAGLLRSPGETGDLIALGLAARRARRTLRGCAPILASLFAGRGSDRITDIER